MIESRKKNNCPPGQLPQRSLAFPDNCPHRTIPSLGQLPQVRIGWLGLGLQLSVGGIVPGGSCLGEGEVVLRGALNVKRVGGIVLESRKIMHGALGSCCHA